MLHRPLLPVIAVATSGLILSPVAGADSDNTLIPNNSRLNKSVVENVFTLQRQAGCTNDVKVNPHLRLAAEWHTHDIMNDRNLDGDIGSDGSTVEDRARAAGFDGKVAETVAIMPALAINNLQILQQWYHNPAYYAIMADCANTAIGVWSENSLDRSVVVAVYGQPRKSP